MARGRVIVQGKAEASGEKQAQPGLHGAAPLLQDVQLQNANAWANLTAAPAAAAPAAPAAPAAAAAAPADEEDDNLWSEFQGREQQQRQQVCGGGSRQALGQRPDVAWQPGLAWPGQSRHKAVPGIGVLGAAGGLLLRAGLLPQPARS